MDRTEANTGTREVSERLRFDERGARIAGSANMSNGSHDGPIAVSQFKGGQSNPTYRIDAGGRSFVLRRKPPGKILPGAHAVEREYRVLAALGAQGFPVPRVYGLCEDESVIGTAFYVMDMVPGRIVWEAEFPGHEPRGARRALRRDERDDRPASQLRSGSDRAWRLWQGDGLRRTPGRALVEAISERHGWRARPGDGPAGRLARQAPPARQPAAPASSTATSAATT